MASLGQCMYAGCCQVPSNAPVHATCMQLCLVAAPLLVASVNVYYPAVLQAGGFDAFAGVLSGVQEATAASQGSAAVAVGDTGGSTAAFDGKEDLFTDAQPGTEATSHSELFGNAQLDMRLLLLADAQAGLEAASPDVIGSGATLCSLHVVAIRAI